MNPARIRTSDGRECVIYLVQTRPKISRWKVLVRLLAVAGVLALLWDDYTVRNELAATEASLSANREEKAFLFVSYVSLKNKNRDLEFDNRVLKAQVAREELSTRGSPARTAVKLRSSRFWRINSGSSDSQNMVSDPVP